MPDGNFVFLLNYIDHGVKKLTCIPIVSKQASTVAFALFSIFTDVGPPSILQTDNGGEFSNHAHDYVGKKVALEDDFIDVVIKELKNLWPECQMVRGSPRHSESNGGVERVNQTVQKKLGGWMKTNDSKHWAIGCKIVQFRVNTQYHKTIKDTPYHLVYGQNPRVGLSNLPLSADVLGNLRTEAQLNEICSEMAEETVDDTTSQLSESIIQQVAAIENAVSTEDALLSMSPPKTKKRERPIQEDSEKRDARKTKQARLDALQNVLLGKPTEDTTTSPTTPNSSVGRGHPLKRSDNTNVHNNWLELYSQRDEPVTLTEIIRGRPGGQGKRYPIIRCFNTKDMTDDANFEPCIL